MTESAADASASSGAVDPALVGFWSHQYTRYSPDGDPVTFDTNTYWTLRDDGTALEAKQDDRLGPDPLTEDLSWTRDGDRLAFANIATGDARQQWDVVSVDADTLVVKKADREEYLVFTSGPVDE